MRKARILVGDALHLLPTLKPESVQCVVTSPPYWGLRDYGTEPSVWEGDAGCAHEWRTQTLATEIGKGNWAQGTNGRGETQPGGAALKREPIRSSVSTGFCSLCKAWLGCFGLEPTPELYIEHAVMIFREVRRVLRDDGTLWLNIGDSYATGAGKVGDCPGGGEQGARWAGDVDRLRDEKRGYRGDRLANGRGEQAAILCQKTRATRDGSHAGKHTAIAALGPMTQPNRLPLPGFKPKDMVGIPWMLAFALRADGWYLRQDIIWSKPNPMPESVRDRCTKAHEYLFLLSKSRRYYFDAEAVAEPVSLDTDARYERGRSDDHKWADGGPGNQTIARTFDHMSKSGNKARKPASARGVPVNTGGLTNGAVAGSVPWEGSTRNKRSVWEIATEPYPEAHLATYPTELVKPCILAGSKPGDLVLDPFAGACTTGLVALRHDRNFLGIEIKSDYVEMARRRLAGDAPLFNVVLTGTS